MTIDRVRVWSVTESRVSSLRSSPRLYLIDAVVDQDGLVVHEQYQTLNAWKATLCEQAKAKHLPVRVTWEPSKYGKRLVRAELIEDAA